MAPNQNPRVVNAFRAMKEYGFSNDVVKPVLENLVRVFDKNWGFIEDENYRVLIDAIMEAEEEKNRTATDNDVLHESEQPLKRQRPSHESQDLFSTQDGSGTSLQGANLNSYIAAADIDPQPLLALMEPPKPPLCITNTNPMDESEPDSPPTSLRLRDRRLTSLKALGIAEASDSTQPNRKTANEMCSTDPKSFIEDVRMDSFPLMEVGISESGNQTGAQRVSNGKDAEEGFARVGNSAIDAVNKVIPPENEMFTSFGNSANGRNDDVCVSLLPEDLSISPCTTSVCISNLHGEGGATDSLTENIKKKEVVMEETGKSVSINTDKGNQSGTKETTYALDVTDITKGEEKVKISIVNHFNDIPLPSFCYIHQSLVGQNAVVNVSLAPIGNKDCCQNCVRDCMSLKEPCICACTTDKRGVYASDGILNEKFLEQNISMTQNPQKHRQFFCEDCPFEVGIDKDALKPCQGHLVRKVVKECWLKCTCNHNCTNRWVQRGISYKLQVYMTSGGKGWGLRTLMDLPKGAFVCEYVGEILTLSELYLRYQKCHRSCAYTMVLDAGWASSKESKEDKDKPLCLDASVYGNVARFINHRCTDANLVEIPVRVESSDHLYHRVAFFTCKKVAALEELTRDYGINFDESEDATKPFRCRCGSSFCRNIKRYNRKRLKESTQKSLISRENL